MSAARSALVVVAHPRPTSFNHALAAVAADELARAGFAVALHDLYAEGFDPIASAEEVVTTRADAAPAEALVRVHQEQLRSAQTLVVVHPNWWGKPPAIMAGWLDRVLAPGVAYRLAGAGGGPTQTLDLRALFVFNTSDTPAERERERFGDPLEAIWRSRGRWRDRALRPRRSSTGTSKARA